MRGALAATAVITAVGLASPPASTAAPESPTPHTASEALKQYKALTSRAEKIQEKFNKAKADLEARQKDLRKAKAEVKQAENVEHKAAHTQAVFRGQVDQLSDASLQGARFNKLSALFTGESKKDFLERASALDIIATNNNDAMNQLASSTRQAAASKDQAENAKDRTKKAADDANNLIKDIRGQVKHVKAEIGKVKDALAKLSPEDQSILGAAGDMGVFIAPSGAAGTAMQAALAQRGKPYEWGAEGPSSFDCSGLMMYAYGKAGIELPHSAASQSEMGQSVSESELQPGDLVFFGDPAYHVGMYVGAGKMVAAPTEGEPVKVDSLADQSDYSGARRLAG
jgi:cell wall-associated NlpC family hydrolase